MTGSGSGSLFSSVIEDHLALKRRNGHLDDRMPIDEFVVDDPFENHPLFKTEDDARREEEETGEHPAVTLDLAADTLSMPVVRARRRGRSRRAGWKRPRIRSSAGSSRRSGAAANRAVAVSLRAARAEHCASLAPGVLGFRSPGRRARHGKRARTLD